MADKSTDMFGIAAKCKPYVGTIMQTGTYTVVIVIFHVMATEWFSSKVPVKQTYANGDASIFNKMNLTDSGNELWFHPPNCSMHRYNRRICCSETRACMARNAAERKNNFFIFCGDSKLYYLCKVFNRFVGDYRSPHRHQDVFTKDPDENINFTSQFYWLPTSDDGVKMYNTNNITKILKMEPAFVIHGFGLWEMRGTNGSDDVLPKLLGNIKKMMPYMKQMSSKSTYIWMLLDPVREDLLDPSRKMLRNKRVEEYNYHVGKLMKENGIIVWNSHQIFKSIGPMAFADGMHLSREANGLKAQVLLNWHCNKYSSLGGLCQSDSGKQEERAVPRILQMLKSGGILCVGVLIIVLCACLQTYLSDAVAGESIIEYKENTTSYTTYLTDFIKLLLILVYFYLCHSTPNICKEKKEFHAGPLIWLFLIIVTLGTASIQKTEVTGWLNRNQTEEWKGWMQLVILFCHYTGAIQVFLVNYAVRLLVSCYLFLFGFGHFSYFWTTGNFHLKRVFQVILRLNLQAVILGFLLQIPYQFYWFVVMVTAWYVLIYLVMMIFPGTAHSQSESLGITWSYTIAYLKIAVLATVLTLVHVWGHWEDSSTQTLYNSLGWKHDRFSVIYGMIFACSYQFIKETAQRSTQAFITVLAIISVVHFGNLQLNVEKGQLMPRKGS